jgi:hypothetical protein
MRSPGLLLLVLLTMTSSCKVTAETKDKDPTKPVLKDTKAAACTTFEGGTLSAAWSECPDKTRREVKCATFIDDLKCDCLEDGVRKTFFMAKDPPLSLRADATRVANANCHWSLESP